MSTEIKTVFGAPAGSGTTTFLATGTTSFTLQRLKALDALRGFDMFWIVGGESFFFALRSMSDIAPFRWLAGQFEHAAWEGFVFYDLIFPLFVFIAGVSMVFSLNRSLATVGKAATQKKILVRFAVLYALALIYSGGFSAEWPEIRLMGVLNRIALCYLAAALIYCNLQLRGIIITCVSLLVGYWVLMTYVPFPDVRPVDASGKIISEVLVVHDTKILNFSSANKLHGVVGPGLNLANYIDQRFLPGKKWEGTWDPEGLLSTFPAIASCLLGVLAGFLLRLGAVRPQSKVYWLFGGGVALTALGYLWGFQFPVIKKIWTSSFVLVAGGYSAMLLAVFYQVIEIWGNQKWSRPFIWIGANAIVIYMANNIVRFDQLAERFAGGDIKRFLNGWILPGSGDFLVAAVTMAIVLTLAWFLYDRKVFIRV